MNTPQLLVPYPAATSPVACAAVFQPEVAACAIVWADSHKPVSLCGVADHGGDLRPGANAERYLAKNFYDGQQTAELVPPQRQVLNASDKK